MATYPFNPTGTLAQAPAENHTVVAAAGSNMSYIVPRAAPFFRSSIKIRNITGVPAGSQATAPLLVEGVDYIVTHRFEEACLGTGKQIYGSISFLNRNFAGQVRIDPYQTLGGNWVYDDYSYVEALTNSLYSIRTVQWTQIVQYPAAFPPIVHDHEMDDLQGMSEVVAAIENLITAVNASGASIVSVSALLNQHLSDAGTHTKAQVGLSNVDNFALATQANVQVANPIINNAFMSPLRTFQMLEFLKANGYFNP